MFILFLKYLYIVFVCPPYPFLQTSSGPLVHKESIISILHTVALNYLASCAHSSCCELSLCPPHSVAVHVVLVTDFLVLLTERDQKYHLAALQDLKVQVG